MSVDSGGEVRNVIRSWQVNTDVEIIIPTFIFIFISSGDCESASVDSETECIRQAGVIAGADIVEPWVGYQYHVLFRVGMWKFPNHIVGSALSNENNKHVDE